jgi:uncharacterized protein with HEPN domain
VSSRDWKLRIQDMISSVNAIRQRIAGMTFEDLAGNETVAKAVFYDFAIIGEAARNIPDEIQARYPQIPWRLMGDARNVMIHEYFQVKLQIVWAIIQNDLPTLAIQLQDLLEREA